MQEAFHLKCHSYPHENSCLLHLEGGLQTHMSTGATWVRTGGVGATWRAEAPAQLASPGCSSVAEFPRFQEKPGIRTRVCGSSTCQRCARAVMPLHGHVALGSRPGASATSPGCTPTFKLGLGHRHQRSRITWGLLAFFLAVVGVVWSGSSRLGRGPFLGTRYRPDPGGIVAATSRPRIAADPPPMHTVGPFSPGV